MRIISCLFKVQDNKLNKRLSNIPVITRKRIKNVVTYLGKCYNADK